MPSFCIRYTETKFGSELIMGVNMQTETFRGFGRTGELNGQTAVECRFGGELETVLAVHAVASLSGAETGNGEVKYFGKVLFSVVYEDAEKHVCRAEKGVEFSAKLQNEGVVPALTARVSLSVENLSVRREGASVYATALIGADAVLYGDTSFDYLTGGDFICRKEAINVLCAHLCGGQAEAEDEFETEFIGDILFHSEAVTVTDVTCEAGLVQTEGEINLGILALKGENALVSFERLIPFRAEIPCEQSAFGCNADVKVSVLSATVRADADETKGKCSIQVNLTLSVEGCLYEEVAVDGVTDAFSCENSLRLKQITRECYGAGEFYRTSERISGKAVLSAPVDFSDTLQAISLQRAEADYVATAEGKRVEGVAMATLLVLGADGSHRGIEMSLPFSVPVQAEGDCRVSVLACGTSARQRQEGEIDGEVTLKICLQAEKRSSFALVASAEEGAPVAQCDSAISVYIPCVGDGLWELSKRLNKSPDDVLASNPDLEFPIREGQRVVIYRKKSVNG